MSIAVSSAVPSLLDAPLATAEFLVVDTETNGLGGEQCEVTEIGVVLVGGGELHERWETLVPVRAPLSRGIQRFTGISQAMVDEAPPAEVTLPELAEQLEGRVLVAHNSSFDRRVLAQAFGRAGLAWPDPPTLCTVALARRLHPLARQRKLRPLAESLGIEVEVSHRALADAETCARVLCALFPRLCANAGTVGQALGLLRSRRQRTARAGRTDGGVSLRGTRRRKVDCSALPEEPGVYIFRNAEGQPLYVGKSVSIRSRAKAHFVPSSPDTGWVAQAEIADHVETASELGALLTEARLIRELKPPGNQRLKHDDNWVYLRCRLDIPYPILEVGPEPAPGRAVNVGPLQGRFAAAELVEQLTSLFELRHCGRGMKRREHPSAYGQMGRCLSPCLGDLDPNAYRRRLDQALALFGGDERDPPAHALLVYLDEQMRRAAAEERFERAGWLRRRRERLAVLLERLGGAMAATHARPRLVLAAHPVEARYDALWIVGGRIAGWAPLTDADDAWARTEAALRGGDGRGLAPCATADEVREIRIATTWLAAHPSLELKLSSETTRARVERFVVRAQGLPAL
ncbi:MAG TPA: exonuclease domain-containing protein [Baekduia sp.]|uniref:exonuclease domain-containing protein n=1 Tax=Baekduia sp. TaxID=2600305 RepID=UPI002BA7DAA8|nr:exonuclease domain-containing protein [Baekduia sp.]HMJ34729.1 exonuclease domain-containing protein [Baekduia sp.]